MAAPMGADGPSETPQMLFQAARAVEFEVADGGTRFLMLLDDRRGNAEVQLLMNWRARIDGNR